MMLIFFVLKRVIMIEYKTCSQCNMAKEIKDFYLCSGKYRSECKKCTVEKNTRYQRSVRAYKSVTVEGERRRLYMRQYYNNNKEKFASYRSKFRSIYPDYYREYYKHRQVEKKSRETNLSTQPNKTV